MTPKTPEQLAKLRANARLGGLAGKGKRKGGKSADPAFASWRARNAVLCREVRRRERSMLGNGVTETGLNPVREAAGCPINDQEGPKPLPYQVQPPSEPHATPEAKNGEIEVGEQGIENRAGPELTEREQALIREILGKQG